MASTQRKSYIRSYSMSCHALRQLLSPGWGYAAKVKTIKRCHWHRSYQSPHSSHVNRTSANQTMELSLILCYSSRHRGLTTSSSLLPRAPPSHICRGGPRALPHRYRPQKTRHNNRICNYHVSLQYQTSQSQSPNPRG